MLVAGGTDRGSIDLLGGDASGSQLQRVGCEQVHSPAPWAMGDEELFPGRELVLKRSDGVYVKRIATGANSWPQQGMHLCRRGGKTLLDHLKGMLNHAIVGAHTTGMHQRNHRSVESIE